MMYLELVSDNYLLLLGPCTCRGEPWCECYEDNSGVRVKVVGELDLGPLLHNLAIAGALTRSFRLGDNAGWLMAENERMYGEHDYANAWRPNTKGRAA